MKKLLLIVCFGFLLLVSTSCNVISGEGEEKIMSPSNNTPPLLGKWEVENVIKNSGNQVSSDNFKELIGTEALFNKDGVILGTIFSKTPEFKIKTVNTIDYLLYKYKLSPHSLGIEDDRVEVITILDDKQFLGEFIKISDDILIVNIEDVFCRMKRTVKEVSMEEVNRYIDIESNMSRISGNVVDDNLQTGLLLGLKTPIYHEASQLPSWNYKTIWINSQKNNIVGIYELDGLLLPRKNGFWKIYSNRITENNSTWDELLAEQILVTKELTAEEEVDILSQRKIAIEPTTYHSIIKNIQFVGNDYISVENVDIDRGWSRILNIYSIDNLNDLKPIKLSDLIGEKGNEIFTESAISVINNEVKTISNEENVGLFRNNGYWIMRGRINYKVNNEEIYRDFNIKTIPPKEMVSYDDQIIPWEALRMLIPDMKDFYSSPNGEFLVAITSNNLEIYRIENGDLVHTPVKKIAIPYDTSIVMSEWAKGRYANIWQNEVIKNHGTQIED